MSEPLVIVGNGMAAARLCEELAQRALGRYAVAVIGEEPRLAYNRVLLSSVLAGEVRASDISLKPANWWSDRGVTLCYGAGVTAADIAARTVTLSDGKALPFAKLVFATGSRPICLPVAGADLPGVLTFRDMSDVASLSHAACRGARVVVIGGGLLGIEAAYGLAKGGAAVTLVHLMDRLMERQLDGRAALLLKRAVEARGIRVLLEVATKGFVGDGYVEGVELKDGRVLAADAVVVAVGIRPNAKSPRKPASRSSAASSSTIISPPARPMFSQSANAPSIAASAMVWSSRPTSRRGRRQSAWPAVMHVISAA